jgi:GNAT superfamily N-acetyltransferase/RimJ/RimL family protein N-acetyltransferase
VLAVEVHVEKFEPRQDLACLRACHAVMEAARPIDHPNLPPQSFESFGGWWAHGGGPQQSWLARDEFGEPVGCCLLTFPAQENTTMAGCCLVVVPAQRRTGLGSELLEHCATEVGRRGRSRLSSTDATRTKVRDGSSGAVFAKAVGAGLGQVEVISTQYVDTELLARLAPMRAELMASVGEYDLVSWLGRTAEDHLAQVVRVNAAMSDAPRDAGVEPHTRDAATIRRSEDIALAQGVSLYSVAARHRGTGRFAALTQMTTDRKAPEWALQQMTGVLPGHRGRRLGTLIKIVMLELLTEHQPAVRRILTGNAASNTHMTAINDQLGYQASDTYRSWDLDVASARRQLR